MVESIQELLAKNGWSYNEKEERFERRNIAFQREDIPVKTILGHSLESFRRLANDHGWVSDSLTQFSNGRSIALSNPEEDVVEVYGLWEQ